MRIRSFLIAALLSLALVGGARAADPSTPRIGPEQGPKVKVEKLLDLLPADEAAQWRSRLGAGELGARDALQKLLCEKVPAYKDAVAAFDKDGTNAEDFEKLAETLANFVTLASIELALGRLKHLRCTMTKAGKPDGEGTFAGARCWSRPSTLSATRRRATAHHVPTGTPPTT